MSYRERPIRLDGAVLWERDATATPRSTRVLPDGCMDIIWDGRRLFVAGPDSTARMHEDSGTAYTALRFSAGLGPVLLGTRADELRDHTPDLEALWPTRSACELAERIAEDPPTALENWALRQSATARIDPMGARLLRMSTAGLPVATIANSLAMSTRQLHRSCRRLFGYGPARLARVLRMQRAVAAARVGRPLADVAAYCGYADQAHLTRDIRALAGTSPSALLIELRGRR